MLSSMTSVLEVEGYKEWTEKEWMKCITGSHQRRRFKSVKLMEKLAIQSITKSELISGLLMMMSPYSQDVSNKVDGLNMDDQIFEERVVSDDRGNLIGN
ncbi:hypothetical protein L1887_27233 [Cichorium endivia]|nr:hypothetical protein L1887_27233 [Cichorium endivia]